MRKPFGVVLEADEAFVVACQRADRPVVEKDVDAADINDAEHR